MYIKIFQMNTRPVRSPNKNRPAETIDHRRVHETHALPFTGFTSSTAWYIIR